LLNSYLDQEYNILLDYHKQRLEEYKIVSSLAIMARYLGQDHNHKTLKELILYHDTNMDSILKPGTMRNYYTTEKYLEKFIIQNLKVNDIFLKQLNYRLICDFEQY